MITYPRTDSRALPEDYIPTVRETLANLPGDLAPHAAEGARPRAGCGPTGASSTTRRCPITSPSSRPRTEAKHLEDMEAKIFDMIARRFVAVFYPAAEFDITTRTSTVAAHDFRTEGKVLTVGGLARRLRPDDGRRRCGAGAKTLPALDAADGAPPVARTLSAELHSETTKPPPRYTEATLLSAMEGAGKLVDDEELAEAMKERGLGTPATRADTIDGLINQQYIERAQRELVPTAKAESLLEFLAAVQGRGPDQAGHDRRVGVQASPDRARPVLARRSSWRRSPSSPRASSTASRRSRRSLDDARQTDWVSPTDGQPMREMLRAYKSQDGLLTVYKVVGNRKLEESEVRTLVATGQVGPLDNFRSKAGRPFSAILKIDPAEKKVVFQFEGQRDGNGAMKIDFTGLQPDRAGAGPVRRRGRGLRDAAELRHPPR